jgi:hypothetical protein
MAIEDMIVKDLLIVVGLNAEMINSTEFKRTVMGVGQEYQFPHFRMVNNETMAINIVYNFECPDFKATHENSFSLIVVLTNRNSHLFVVISIFSMVKDVRAKYTRPLF